MNPDYYKRPLFLFLLLFVIYTLSTPKNIPPQDIYHLAPAEVTLTGKVLQTPQVKSDRINVYLKVLTLNGAPAKSKTYARLPADAQVNFQDIIEIDGALSTPFAIAVRGNFNWQSYLANKNIYTQINARSARIIKPAPWFIGILNRVRKDILQMFKDNFDPNAASVMGGIVLGEKGEIPQDLHRAFNDSGAMHLLVASGGNVGFVTVLIYYLCFLLGVKYTLRLPLALIFAGIYTVLAGADPPLLRAYIMAICTGAGLTLGRNSGAFHGLTFAALIILLINPYSIKDTGFQMSFLATAVILLSTATFKLPQKCPFILKAVAETFLITTAVQLVLLPLYANIFYRFSITAVVSNIFLVPLSAVLMGLGFALYALKAAGITFLFKAVLFLTQGTVWLFNALVTLFSSARFSAVDIPALSIPGVVIFFICLFFIYNSNIFKYKKSVVCALAAVMAAVFIFNPFKPKNYVYILNAFNHSAIILNLDGKTITLRSAFPDNLLQNALYSLSKTKADLELSSNPNPQAKKQLRPFKDIWPGEEILFKNISINAEWGLNKGYKNYWVNTGYSGTAKDSISYKIKNGRTVFTGGTNDFVKVDGLLIEGQKNKDAEFKF